MQLFRKLFLTKLRRIPIWIIINYINNCRHIICKMNLFCVDLLIPKSLWLHKGFGMQFTHKTMHRFSTMQVLHPPFMISLANFSFIIYQNKIIQVIIGFKNDVPCIVRSEALRATWICECTLHYTRLALTDPCVPFVPPISQRMLHHA